MAWLALKRPLRPHFELGVKRQSRGDLHLPRESRASLILENGPNRSAVAGAGLVTVQAE